MSYSEKVFSISTGGMMANEAEEQELWFDLCDVEGCTGTFYNVPGSIRAVCDQNPRHWVQTECCEGCAGLE